jgi:hypothetical protein
MASPPLQPTPLRSPEDLRHPVPDLQSLQGAYIGNIERLEEHAERMSEAGSDLGEEIRKTYSELKLVDSRRSSLQTGDEITRHISTRSRGNSTVSHANSIVGLNGNARWGGYSPGGHAGVTSPVGSLRSGTWSNPPTSVQRQRSESKASRLGQIVHPEQVEEEEEYDHEANPASPKALQSTPLERHEHDSSEPPQRKVSSFTRIFDEVANGLPEDLRNSINLGTPPKFAQQTEPEDNEYEYVDPSDIPDRPPTAASTDTTHQARTLWMDFDGVHCPDTVQEEPEPSQGSRTHSRQSSNMSAMMRSNPELPSTMAPPPDDGMVFYPAPVPRMLNLPKRLSQLPASNVAARRRTQLLESMQTENRKSMPLLGESTTDLSMANKRKSRQSLMNLPPQLRASAYFDNQVAPTQEFAVKGESAEATLESILDASARAPVSAFTDHPITGNVGSKDVYAPEHKRTTSKLPEVPPTLQETRRRSSFNLLDTKHKSNGEATKKLKKRNSSADMNLLLIKASESRMSLGDQLEERDEDARGPQGGHVETPTRPSFQAGDDDRNPDDVYEEEALDEDDEEEEQQYGAPTTLLAELQLRKAKQKTRNMNYVTLMEQGLINGRQTLLQLNDVAEAEKQRRIRKKVNLAWEAPEDDSDDDVPLGVLYRQPGSQQHPEPRRQTMGLIEQRELEDHEPLSSRRSRLQGGNPNARRTQYLGASSSQLNLPTIATPEPESDEEEGETLADRMRRLREKKEREAALGDDVRKSTVSGDFASEMFGQFGVPESPKDASKPSPLAGANDDEEEEEEETLGQRRARLQAERGDQPATPGTRPALGPRASTSLADLLAANPLDTHNQARKVSNEMLVSHLPQGSLLHQNELDSQKRKQQRLTATMRASSYGDTLVKVGKGREEDDDDVPLGQKIAAYKQAQNPMMLNAQMSGMGGQRTSTMGMAMQQPMMGMGMNGMPMPMQMQGMQHPGMMRQSSMMMPMPMGMQMQMPMGMNGMPMQMPMGMPMGMGMMGPPMDPRQRDQIDRWMQGIKH